MIDKFKLYMDGLPYELVYYLEIGENAGKTIYKVMLKEEDQVNHVTKEMYEYFKTLSYAYGFEVVEEEKEYSVSSEEDRVFYDTYLYSIMGDSFFETLMN